MEKLPIEIKLDIISRLPVESVLQCKQVCRSWQTSINLKDPWFTRMHFHHLLLLQQHNASASTTIPAASGGGGGVELGFVFLDRPGQLWYKKYDENDDQSYKTVSRIYFPPSTKVPNNPYVFMIGSCNGLICLYMPHDYDDNYDYFYVFNPITREHIDIPRLFISNDELEFDYLVFGFGYHSSTNEYKVVRIINASMGDVLPRVQVYTLGGGSQWRDKGEIPYHSICSELGVLLNGELHWLIQGGSIVAFDLENEGFHFIASAPFNDPDRDWYDNFDSLCVLGGLLCLVHEVWDSGSSHVEVWVLNKNSSNSSNSSSSSCNLKEQCQSWSWSKEFTISVNGHGNISPLALTKRGELLLIKRMGFFFRYDPKTGKVEKLVDDKEMKYNEVIPHIFSFVSLKSLGEALEEAYNICPSLVS